MRSAQNLLLNDPHDQSEVEQLDRDDAVEMSDDEGVETAAEQSRSPVRWRQSNEPRRSSRRPVRAVLRFCLAVVIGVVGTLSWQAYGNEVQDTVRTLAPSLDWLIPPAATNSSDARSAQLAEQLKPIALDLAVVRKAVEQLSANQEQLAAKNGEIAQNIAALQTNDQQLGDKISTLSAPKAADHAVPARRPPQHAPLSLTGH